MNFVRYNPETGELTCIGYMDVEHIQAEIDAGEPTLLLSEPSYFSLDQKRVNLKTMALEDIPTQTDTGGNP